MVANMWGFSVCGVSTSFSVLCPPRRQGLFSKGSFGHEEFVLNPWKGLRKKRIHAVESFESQELECPNSSVYIFLCDFLEEVAK